MADDAQTIRSINWRELFPFTHLFRAFRIAIHPSKLVLGFAMLFLLYGGGRALDWIWPAHNYAIWNEIDQYQQYKWAHVPAATFNEAREQQRAGNQRAYAGLLVKRNIQNNPDSAMAAAGRGEFKGDLQAAIVKDRNKEIDKDRQARDGRLKDIDADKNMNAQQRQDARKSANDAYEGAMRNAQAEMNGSMMALNAISPRPLFDTFFEYEIRQFHNIVDSALTWNWLNGVMGASGPEPASLAGRNQDIFGLVGGTLTRSELEARDPAFLAAAAIPGSGNTNVGVLRSIANFTIVGPGWLIRYHWFYFALYGIWFLLLWAIFGGAICRIAAVHVGRDEKISVRQALRFSTSKLLSFVFAPLIPLIIIVFLGILAAVGGLLMYVPVIGPILVGIFFFLALIAGFIMTLVATGTVAGFNLMYPTIAVEGSDSFDAISRSFSYVFARPWRMIFYTVLSLIYGALCFLFVRYFVYVMLELTHYFAQWGLLGQPRPSWPEIWPRPSDQNLAYHINFHALAISEALAAFLIASVSYLVLSFLAAFVVSFYFSSNTLIYFLMRREVDSTELDDVYIEESDDDFGDGVVANPTPHTPSPTPEPASSPAGTTPPDVAPVT